MFKINNGIYFEKCHPIKEHAKQIMEWRNDPTTLSMFYHHEPKTWNSFWNEYRNTYFNYNQNIHPVFAIFDCKRVGFLKFSPINHPNDFSNITVDISINISPDARGKGLGKKVLKSCIKYLCHQGVDSIYAEVLSQNTASIKTFKSAGFLATEQKEKFIIDTGETHSIQCFLINISANHWQVEVEKQDLTMTRDFINVEEKF